MGRQTIRELPVELQLPLTDVYNNSKKGSKPNSSDRDPDNTPPNSRLFVVCGKELSEEELLELFQPYGKIEYCRLIKDKKSQESKGLCYVKFAKASSAADALENLDGTQLKDNGALIKVHIADAKGTAKNRRKLYSTEPEDTPPRSRLFVVCPKEMTEEMLNERFKQIDGLEYCKVISDKQTGESKGFAYVKFNKASAAALAMESVSETGEIASMKVKVLIADPKNKRTVNTDFFSMPPMDKMGYPYPMQIPPYAGIPPFIFPYPILKQRIVVMCHKSVTVEDLTNVFAQYPGLEYCELDPLPQSSSGEPFRCAYAYFSSPQSAMIAAEQLDGYEIPAGYPISCALDQPSLVMSPLSNSPPDGGFMVPPHLEGYGNMGMYPPPMIGYPPLSYSVNETWMQEPPRLTPVYFSIPGGLLHQEILDQFGQYGHIEFVNPGSDGGVVNFTDYMSAQAAVQELDGTEIDGRVMEVSMYQERS